MKKSRLNKTEKLAEHFCMNLRDGRERYFCCTWGKSREWGRNPRIMYDGVTIASASGSGYDKESAALSDALRFLFEHESEEYRRVWGTNGCGRSSVERVLKELGIEFGCVADIGYVTTYRIKVLPSSKAYRKEG